MTTAADSSPWGMVLHYPNEHLIDVLNHGGVKWMRFTVPWSLVAESGPPDWASYGRTVMTAARKRDMRIYLGLDIREPGWIAAKPHLREQSYQWFIQSVMDWFGDRAKHNDSAVRYIHIGNEPNDPAFYPAGAAEYRTRLARAIRIIRDHDRGRGFKACAPDLAIEGPDPGNFLRACIQTLRENNVMFDVLALHGYIGTTGSASELMFKLGRYSSLMRDLGLSAIPIWLTETGVNMLRDTANNPNDITQLCNFVRNGWARLGFSVKLDKVFWFVWSEDDNQVAGVEGKYSWLTRALVPRPREWAAYSSVTGIAPPHVKPELDGTVTVSGIALRAGTTRTLTVNVANTGVQPWTGHVRLTNVDYRRMPDKLTPESVAVPLGGGPVSVPITAPYDVGPHQLRLQLTNHGEQFGSRAVITVTVVDRTAVLP